MPTPKHMRRLTTWQVFCQVERRFRSRKSNREPRTSSSRFGYLFTIIQLFRVVSDQTPPLFTLSLITRKGVSFRAGSDHAQVKRRSVTFWDQTMSRGEAFGLKKYIKIIHTQILNILMKKKFGLSTKVWVEHFARPKLCSRGRTLGAIIS